MVKPSAKRRLILLLGVLGVMVSILAVTAVTSDRRVCATCHRSFARSLASSAHAGADCYACHLPDGLWSLPQAKLREFLYMYPGRVFGDKLIGPANKVSRRACVRCHEEVQSLLVESKGLRIFHQACSPASSKCVDCHSLTAHGQGLRWVRVPVMDKCISCHSRSRAPLECDFCHEGKLRTARLDSGPWQVTHGPKWRETHGMGDLATCKTCHPREKCVGCHKTPIPHESSFGRDHGVRSLKRDSRCRNCHADSFCSGCHGLEMPHPKGFIKDHPRVTAGYTDPTCMKCHSDYDCWNCHLKHTHPGNTEGDLDLILKGQF